MCDNQNIHKHDVFFFSSATCYLPVAVGRCSKTETRYHYDHETQDCKRFPYGGCFGNKNNFRSDKECQELNYLQYK